MRKVFFIGLTISFLMACNDATQSRNINNESFSSVEAIYPKDLSKVFSAHGGINTWNIFKGLYFELGNDNYFVNLKDRSSLIEYESHKLGFDGENVWLKNLDTITYKSNPKFMYNLMFYFYAMPFVLGDDGINYEESEPLVYGGKEFPGISISYNSGVGTSPDDEYILYYDPDTYLMSWLGYTVTYFSKEKSDNFRFIKYDEWEDVDGVKLPRTLQWFNYEGRTPTTKRNDRVFLNAKLKIDSYSEDLFRIPDTTMIVK